MSDKKGVILMMHDADTVGFVIGPFDSEDIAAEFRQVNQNKLTLLCSYSYVTSMDSPEDFLK